MDEYPNRRPAALPAKADPYEDRRAELHRLSPRLRIRRIEFELRRIASLATTAATFHRKKLLRMHDDARLETGLVTAQQLQSENSPFVQADFRQAKIVWQPRRAAV